MGRTGAKRTTLVASVCLLALIASGAWASVTSTPLARGTVDRRIVVSSLDVAAAIGRTGHDSGATVDRADLEVAMERIGHNYGRSVDSGDVDVLVAATGGHDHLPTTALATTDVVMVELMVPAGESIPWHRHPGPAIVVVAEGAFEVLHADCAATRYAAGDAFVDEGHVHGGRAPAGTSAKLYVTYLIPEAASPAVPVEAPDC